MQVPKLDCWITFMKVKYNQNNPVVYIFIHRPVKVQVHVLGPYNIINSHIIYPTSS